MMARLIDADVLIEKALTEGVCGLVLTNTSDAAVR